MTQQLDPAALEALPTTSRRTGEGGLREVSVLAYPLILTIPDVGEETAHLQ